MSLLITGGTGYIGSHIVIEASNNGYRDIVIVDNLSNSKKDILSTIQQITSSNIIFYEIDLKNTEELHKIFKTHKIQYVLHLAGLKSVQESTENSIKYYDNNLVGTISLLKVMQKHSVHNIVFSSSATVYGVPKKLPITEDAPLNPINPYGKTKEMIEIMLKDLTYSLRLHSILFKVVILRYFNPIGAHPNGKIGESPNQIPNNLMPYITSTANKIFSELSIYGNDYPTKDGTGIRDYIHVVDLAKAHIQSLKLLSEQLDFSKNVVFPYIANIGTGKGYSVLEIIKAFENANGCNIPYRIANRREGDIASCYADPTYAQETLQWKAQFSLEDMCKDSWNWSKQNY